VVQPFRLPSPTNIHPVATPYVIGFIRDESEFPLNRYIKLVEAPAATFFYHELERDQQARNRGGAASIATRVWQDGADRPSDGAANQFGFREVQASVVRYDYPSRVGWKTLKAHQKNWGIKQVYLKMLGSQAMTYRTNKVVGILENTATWPTGHNQDANTLNGGYGPWDLSSDDSSSPRYQAIKKTITAAASQIFKDTNSKVKWKDLRLILNPESARKTAQSREIVEYMKYGPSAEKQIDGNTENYNEQWGLPRKLYNVEVVVEDTVYVSDQPDEAPTTGSTARSYAKADSSAVLVTRPGAIDGVGGPAFETLQVWWHDNQMKVQEIDDSYNERTDFHIVDEFVPVVPAGVSGMLITGILS
jgi:hypothetical protein